MYKRGDYADAIHIALDNTDKIRAIIERISKRQLPKNWLPFNIRCTSCGHLKALHHAPLVLRKLCVTALQM